MSVLNSQGMLSFLTGSCWSYSVFSYVTPTYFVPTYVIIFYLIDDIKFFFLYLAVVGPILRGSAGTAGHDYVQFRSQLWLYFAGRPGAFFVCGLLDYVKFRHRHGFTSVVSLNMNKSSSSSSSSSSCSLLCWAKRI
jgi:hypothetical protein